MNKGLPFRQAHEVVGRIVLDCVQKGITLLDVDLGAYQTVCPLIEEDVYEKLQVSNVTDARKSGSGTARERVLEVLRKKRKEIDETLDWLNTVIY